MPKSSPERSLAYHFDFRQLWIGDGLSQVGAQLTALALPIYAVTTLGASEMEMGFLNAAQTAAFLLIGLPAGAWIDRMRKRGVLITADLVRGLVLGAVVVLALTGHGTMTVLIVASLILSVATVFFDVAHLSYVPGLVGLRHVSEGNTKLQATYSIAAVAVPAVGGMMLKIVSAPFLIAVNVVTYFLSVIFLGRIKKREELPPSDSHLPMGKAIAEGLNFIIKTPLLNRLVFATGASAIFSTMGWTMLIKYAVTDLKIAEGEIGVIMSASAIGGIIGALIVRKMTLLVGEGRIIALSALATPILFIGIPLAATLMAAGVNPMIPLIVSGFMMQISNTFFNVSQVSFRQRLCPPHLLGRMNASFRFIVWGGMPIASLLAGVIATHFGMVTMMWVVVVGEILAALPLVLSKFVTMRDLPGGGTIQDVDVS
ncbi:MFS transporter [Timonella senegalensis]|jgi:MFS family permease|uniref:MFS transporter n=1 Tax=Timonella senegalensis TaxID=1465825 RepID=UPI0028A9BAC6|nr:MFS transporter [Timonella senegalensis]